MTVTRRIRVLALASYPLEAASSRYRIVQFIGPLSERGIDVTFSSFLDAPLFAALYTPGKLLRQFPRILIRTLRRLVDIVRSARADVVFVQREAMLFGPPIIEWFVARLLRRPVVLDLDDATWISYPSPVYGRAATFLKWPSKTDRLIRWASAVACGSPHVATYARSLGASATLIPATVDTRVFKPLRRDGARVPVVGWIGTHGTYAYLERLFPILTRLRRETAFTLLIAGAGRDDIDVPGVETITRSWSLESEVADFQSLDIGLYPIVDDEWSAGKSGLKAVQYMACGVPFVMSPVGVCATMGIAGGTHFAATTDDEWYEHLRALLTNENLRQRMGASGRAFAEAHYDIDANADLLADLIRDVART